jgi:hypothetical protein
MGPDSHIYLTTKDRLVCVWNTDGTPLSLVGFYESLVEAEFAILPRLAEELRPVEQNGTSAHSYLNTPELRRTEMKLFGCSVARTVLRRVQQYASVQVEAENEAAARRKLAGMCLRDDEEVCWEDDYCEEEDEEEEFEVLNVEDLGEVSGCSRIDELAALLAQHTPDEVAAALTRMKQTQSAQ